MKSISPALMSTLPLCLALAGCEPSATLDNSDDSYAPSTATVAHNQQVLKDLPFTDRQDFENARRGLIASEPGLQIHSETGDLVWDMRSFDFIQGDAPDSVNPSLWRQESLNNIHGLFEVTEGVYQLRGYGLANMSLIEGERGWIVVDPLTAGESAAAGLAMARQHLGDKPVTAVIFTHSHIDHFGGVLGLFKEGESTDIPVIAPVGFMEEATSENVIAGAVMSRRATYMFGRSLERSPRGHVGSGLGKATASGSVGILSPTQLIDHTPQPMTIDGVDFIFQNVPGSEAPAELTFYLPRLKAYCGAEMVSRNMHNIYTLRGAKVRDALRWSNYIDEAINLFSDSDVYFGSHHWPLWGRDKIVDFLEKQRDTYKYIHDQTLRLASKGFTPKEIAETIELPPTLASSFPNRGYYGTAKHNSKAVYQFYFGWYDGNPANLNPLPPEQSADRYVKAMGGPEQVLQQAQAAFDEGDYRWTSQLLNHLVFSDADNQSARALLSRSYHQLAYQAESGPWRDVYLTAGKELIEGASGGGTDLSAATELLRRTPIDQFLNLVATMLKGPEAIDEALAIQISFTDLDTSYLLTIQNAVLHHRQLIDAGAVTSNSHIQLTHALFVDMLTGKLSAREIILSDQLSLDGSKLDLIRFFSLLDSPAASFNIVTP
ncbi:MAG: MBL fold metallo-hydrolase [Halieaceae bacterium]|jgi:alkyl sulfatase BDS1-like metallo-beta-lactamase superfamily hydrolase|nr:MBL fold metallo-hydrolase [Halieaceae bacterium]